MPNFKLLAAGLFAPVLAAMFMISTTPMAMAEHEMNDLDEPLNVTFQNELDAETLKGGEEFTAVLSEDHVYNDTVLPKGTVFYGHVAKVKKSKAFLRPGYLGLAIDKAVFPSGVTYSFDADRFKTNLEKIRPQQAGPRRNFWRDNVPMGVVSSGTSIPLKVASNLGGGVVYVIALGTRMAYGATDELLFRMRDHSGRDGEDRLAYGMMRGTGLTTAASFTSLANQPSIAAGETEDLYVNEDWLNSLFAASENVNVLMKAEPEEEIQEEKNLRQDMQEQDLQKKEEQRQDEEENNFLHLQQDEAPPSLEPAPDVPQPPEPIEPNPAENLGAQ